MNNFVVAKYIRLSIEDSQTSSLSIENQRNLLDAHIKDLSLHDAEIIEFVDNGYSGTNFERPAMQRLIELARCGKVDCIMVKDLSRFGRNMIEAGYYMEKVFPLYRVRFISASDSYDSSHYENDTGGLEIVFKHLIHEYTSKDMSRKIKAARHAKSLRGEYICANCVYGYKKHNNSLVVDDYAAEIVRLIFKLASEGYILKDIASQLYEQKVLTPSEYKSQLRAKPLKEPICIWRPEVIRNILSDEQYIGTYIAGKTKTAEIGSRKIYHVDKSEWIRIPNHHTAIVSDRLFNYVQEGVKSKPKSPITDTPKNRRGYSSPLKGLVKCECCGRTMAQNRKSGKLFSCLHTLSAPDIACHKLSHPAQELEQGVFSELQKKVADILQQSHLVRQEFFSPNKHSEENDFEVTKRELYEKLILGQVSKAEYLADRELLESHSYSVAHSPKSDLSAKLQVIAVNLIKEETLSREYVETFINVINIHPDNTVSIVWNNEALSTIA